MYSIFTYLAQPFVLLLLFIGLGIVVLWRQVKEKRRALKWVTAWYLTLLVFCVPAVGHLALGTLEWQNPPVDQRPEDIQAIVVLGSGIYPADTVRKRLELDGSALQRCLLAAELYHQGKPCPVLVTGGKPSPEDPACSEPMRDFLIQLGVRPADLLVETQSLTTYENAAESRKILDQRRLHKVILVTDAAHMVRSVACFRKQGIEVVPAGCRYLATEFKWHYIELLPGLGGANKNREACYEWLGLAWYWLKVRI